MKSSAYLCALVLIGSAAAEPIQQCSDGVMFIADDEDLCRFHWCTGGVNPIQMLCAPGARVPTWFVTSPTDKEIPCLLDHSNSTTCLRCDFPEDPRIAIDRDDCANNPCPDGCICQDNWQESFCLCPDNEVLVATGTVVNTQFCDPLPCQNGATCFSQWDDYWCQCPPGYTGKNCETPFCNPNPCLNGGTCTLDEVNYHCECTECFDGSCCATELQSCRRPVVPTTPVPTPSPTTTPAPTTTQRQCGQCQWGANCELNRDWLCSCNSCPGFDDRCTDGTSQNDPRICTSQEDNTGNPFTLMFMQNRPDNTDKRELEIYVTPAGVAAQAVSIFTPFLPPSDPCFYNTTTVIPGFTVNLVSLPNPECYETVGSGTFNNKALRVQSAGGDLLVYAINRETFSADGWIALPDAQAGTDFYTVSYAPATYGTQFSVLNIQDEPVSVTLTYTGRATPALQGTQFVLQPGEVRQIQALGENQDLSGTRIQSSAPVNVYSGNIRVKVSQVENGANINTGSRDHIVEQLTPVNTWGSVFNIQPIPGRTFGDQIKVVGSQDGTNCRLSRRESGSGLVTNEQFTVTAGGLFTRDIIAGSTYRLVCSQRVQLSQITKSQVIGSGEHDPSLITVPPVEQFANRYIFNTPSFSGGTGSKRPYLHRLVLISARSQDRDFIVIKHINGDRRLSDIGTWQQVPNSNYYNIVGELDVGTSLILYENPSGVDDPNADFMCIFYGYDDRESLGFPIGMKLQVIDANQLRVASFSDDLTIQN